MFLGYNSADDVAAQADLEAGSPEAADLSKGAAAVAATASGDDEPVSIGGEVSDGDVGDESTDSDADVATTLRRLEQAATTRGLTPVATVDHARNARSVGERLRPTSVFFAGNPEVGTMLMQEAQTIGIDLPLRFLVTRDGDGEVEVSYPEIRDLASRHGISGIDDVLGRVAQVSGAVARAAAGAGTGNRKGNADD